MKSSRNCTIDLSAVMALIASWKRASTASYVISIVVWVTINEDVEGQVAKTRNLGVAKCVARLQ